MYGQTNKPTDWNTFKHVWPTKLPPLCGQQQSEQDGLENLAPAVVNLKSVRYCDELQLQRSTES
jgi:hypothetical protein